MTTWYRMTIEVPMDDEVFAGWDGEAAAPPNDLEDWIGSDVFVAASQSILDADDAQLIAVEKIGEPS